MWKNEKIFFTRKTIYFYYQKINLKFFQLFNHFINIKKLFKEKDKYIKGKK